MNTYVRSGLRSKCWHMPTKDGSGTMLCGAELTCEHKLVTAMTVENYVRNNPNSLVVKGWHTCKQCAEMQKVVCSV